MNAISTIFTINNKFNKTIINRTSRLPVFYVYGRKAIDVDNFSEEFAKTFPLNDTSKKMPIIFYDVWYHHIMAELSKALDHKGYTQDHLVFTQLQNFQEAQQRGGRAPPSTPAGGNSY